MKNTLRSVAVAAALAALTVVAPTGGAKAFSFNRTISLHPIVLETFLSGMTHTDGWTCGIFACFSTNGLIPDAAASVLLKPFDGRIAVGYDYFQDPGTNPCPCGSLTLTQFRGGVSFRTVDIPDNFLVATLVLDAKKVNKFANSTSELLTGLYETKAINFDTSRATVFTSNDNRPFFTFDTRHDQWTLVSGDIGDDTAAPFQAGGNQLTTPVISPFPTKTSANSQPVQRNGDSYRINVSNVVRSWIADWPNRLKTPIHGFLLTGRFFQPN